MAKRTSIRCPHCGYEYLPAEIYYPKEFLGDPSNIVRNEEGQIIGFDGDDMKTQEEYCCDQCGKTFKIDATITFKTEADKDLFEEESW